ncbi:hypothetical protein T439DRAFT_47134 [Meredithblackwellia eburnea MCA 4105]
MMIHLRWQNVTPVRVSTVTLVRNSSLNVHFRNPSITIFSFFHSSLAWRASPFWLVQLSGNDVLFSSLFSLFLISIASGFIEVFLARQISFTLSHHKKQPPSNSGPPCSTPSACSSFSNHSSPSRLLSTHSSAGKKQAPNRSLLSMLRLERYSKLKTRMTTCINAPQRCDQYYEDTPLENDVLAVQCFWFVHFGPFNFLTNFSAATWVSDLVRVMSRPIFCPAETALSPPGTFPRTPTWQLKPFKLNNRPSATATCPSPGVDALTLAPNKRLNCGPFQGSTVAVQSEQVAHLGIAVAVQSQLDQLTVESPTVSFTVEA